MRFTDQSGQFLALGTRLAQGGEGVVYRLQSRSSSVAKIYSKPLTREKAAKLKHMVSVSTPELSALACWPSELVLSPKGEVCGFVMPYADGYKEVYRLYSPKARANDFNNVDWRFLVATCANIARAFAVVHKCGHVIGDVNQSCAMVSPNATVKIIDCDSFQVSSPSGALYKCLVATPGYTPPELQGSSLANTVRTKQHDNFGLAVMLFHLLFMGRHPYVGKGASDLPLEERITKNLFAYGSNAKALAISRPPNTLALQSIGDPVGRLFERAFTGGAQSRPHPSEWISALDDLRRELVKCKRDVSHYYPKALKTCPWCPIEAAVGLTLFNIPTSAVDASKVFSIGAVWQAIQAVPDPGPAKPVSRFDQVASGKASPKVATRIADNTDRLVEIDSKLHATKIAAKRNLIRNLTCPSAVTLAVVLLGFASGVGLVTSVASIVGLLVYIFARKDPKNAEMIVLRQQAEKLANDLSYYRANQKNEVTKQLSALKQQLWLLTTQWNSATSGQPFKDLMYELESSYQNFQQLDSLRAARFANLQSNARTIQLMRYLDGHRLKPGLIQGIGQGRCATLASFGIETAADVTQEAVLAVPGFGEALTWSLLGWRLTLESRFKFNPNAGVDPRDIKALDAEIAKERAVLIDRLNTGAQRLKSVSSRILLARTTLEPQIKEVVEAIATAKEDLRIVSS